MQAAAPESRLDWFQNPTVNKGLGAGLATIALAGLGLVGDEPPLATGFVSLHLHLLRSFSCIGIGIDDHPLRGKVFARMPRREVPKEGFGHDDPDVHSAGMATSYVDKGLDSTPHQQLGSPPQRQLQSPRA